MIRSSSSNGSPTLRKKNIDFRARPNGNMRRAGGTQTRYWWGDQLQSDMANCRGCGGGYDPLQPLKVGSFKPNPFGLHDMGGSVDQWVEDCWHKDYQGAPIDGSAWIEGTARRGSYDQVPGRTTQATFDLRAAIATIRACGIQPTGSALSPHPERSVPCGPSK